MSDAKVLFLLIATSSLLNALGDACCVDPAAVAESRFNVDVAERVVEVSQGQEEAPVKVMHARARRHLLFKDEDNSSEDALLDSMPEPESFGSDLTIIWVNENDETLSEDEGNELEYGFKNDNPRFKYFFKRDLLSSDGLINDDVGGDYNDVVRVYQKRSSEEEDNSEDGSTETFQDDSTNAAREEFIED